MENRADYFLPFVSTINPIRISQGRNGPWSHFLHRREVPARPGVYVETDLVNAVDFALPVGTPVLASRQGRVNDFWLKSNFCYEGLEAAIGNNLPPLSTNFMIIDHDDGTQAWYSHLGTDVLVARGQSVEIGDIIAKTGKSGWIAKVPHLHFQVIQKRSLATLPVIFQNYSGSLDHNTLLREGLIYFG